MSKQKQPKSQHKPDTGHKAVKTGHFKDHDLCGVNPLKQQFEPTPAEPVRQRARMAGV